MTSSGSDGDEGGFLAARRAVLDALSGETDSALSTLSGVAELRFSEHVGQRSVYLWAAVLVHFAPGDMGKVLAFLGVFLEAASAENHHSAQGVRDVVPLALDAALALGRPAEAETLLADMERHPAGLLAPSVLLQLKRGRALLRAGEGDDQGLVATLSEVERCFAELGFELWRARVAQDLATHPEEMGRRAQDRLRAGAPGSLRRCLARPEPAGTGLPPGARATRLTVARAGAPACGAHSGATVRARRTSGRGRGGRHGHRVLAARGPVGARGRSGVLRPGAGGRTSLLPPTPCGQAEGGTRFRSPGRWWP